MAASLRGRGVLMVGPGKGAKGLTPGPFESRQEGLQGQLCSEEEEPPSLQSAPSFPPILEIPYPGDSIFYTMISAKV